MSWYSWLRNLWRPKAPRAAPSIDPNATADFPSTTPAIAVHSGASRLLVGVVTTVGNYREINEDNFYVPGLGTLHNLASAAGGRPGEAPPSGNGSGVHAAAPAPAPTSAPVEPVLGRGAAMEPTGLFLVADGMGGQLAGEQASRLAVEQVPRELAQRLGAADDDRATQAAIRAAVAAANREIIAQAHVMPEFTNMGTTVVLTLFRKNRAFVAGLGDSRAYRLRDGRLEQLTKDHSLANALREAGTITAAEVENHRFQNVLYNYLGCPEARDGPEDVRIVDVQSGDKFLMASDGLTGVVRDGQLAELLGRFDDPQQAAQALVNRALANDSKDNVTCVVIYAV